MKQIVVIGGGPAGYPAALEAARLGAQVTLIEKNKVGGVCLNCGCIPSKSLLDAAHKLAAVLTASHLCQEDAAPLAQALFEKRDWKKLQARQQKATQKLVQGIGFLLKKAGVTVVQGEASFVDEHTLSVKTAQGTQTLAADGVIVATGSSAFFPAPLDTLKDQIYDNSTLFDMPALPTSITIVGGGVIGCEMADFLSALGVTVHVVEMQPRILPQEDETAARTLERTLTKRGVILHTGVSVTQAQADGDQWKLTLSDGKELHTEKILAAIGRSVDTSALHLENIGVQATRKGLSVNPQTLQLKGSVYAAGDVTGLCQLAHAATRQGEVAARNLCGQTAVYHNENVPRAIYTAPEIAGVGLTKAQAAAQDLAVKAHKTFFLANGRAVAQDQTDGYIELLSAADTGKLVGATIVGAHASELIHILSVALQAGFTLAQLKEVIFAHPTLAEAVSEATRV
ncbi:MAG: dihydrolipoyl dehydrogenase [Elusimicrobiaceae bacterium]|nr:dihydrolipoyl dehydrogenase [Elusimicrobiaceae bacterium]